ncbi:ATP-grasp domain-containing protein [Streptomyces tirandamycinicus]|uniref:ATP-grasp domain-containing protein n=1 Tax=Streptomyces tirandamycinicus TaxID=2174846 RepID=UPI002271E191|nr:ATP-grasp domain-containing protein [Streptomyces tirandamycinicus]MCY0980322.1 ATP-grasp domain-containing protein [Streptomyces tirandamycinicus]
MTGSRSDDSVLAVVYDKGAASPGEIGVGLSDLGRLAFLVPDTSHVARLRGVLEHLGQVVPLTGEARADNALLRRIAPTALLTYSELMLRTTASLAAAAGLPFHSVDTARILTDKVRQRRLLHEAGVDDVRTHPLSAPEQWPQAREAVGLPAVIKPAHGAASRNTHAVTDDAQARALLPEVFAAVDRKHAGSGPPLIVEEMLQGRPSLPYGDYASVESLCTPDGVTHLALSGKLPLLTPFRESGRFWPTHLPTEEQHTVLALVSRALKALGVTYGLTHTELKLTPTGPRIIEVNGRLGGHVNGLARTACGTDLVRLAALVALGEPVDPPVLRPDRVHFQHHGLAPTEPCVLEAVHGAEQLRQLPGIDGYRTFTRSGEQLPGGVLTHEMDVVWGTGTSHEAMTETLDRALAVLSYDFRFASGVRRISAAALRDSGLTGTSLIGEPVQ